jgi:phage baseplate assembly protein W
MDGARILGKGISFPPRLGPDGRMAWSDGEANVRDAVKVILLTRLNERVMLPQFGSGLDSFLFEPNTVATRHQIQEGIENALRQWEPRIVVEDVVVDPDAGDPEAAMATIAYRLVATQARERVRLTINLASQ